MFKDKNQAVKHPADILPKKVGETLPPQSSQMGYGIYHFCECEYSTQPDVNSHETDETFKIRNQYQHFQHEQIYKEKKKTIIDFWNAHASFAFIFGLSIVKIILSLN